MPAKNTRKESFKMKNKEQENNGRYLTLTLLSHQWLMAV
jgi:hypothetical protein